MAEQYDEMLEMKISQMRLDESFKREDERARLRVENTYQLLKRGRESKALLASRNGNGKVH